MHHPTDLESWSSTNRRSDDLAWSVIVRRFLRSPGLIVIARASSLLRGLHGSTNPRTRGATSISPPPAPTPRPNAHNQPDAVAFWWDSVVEVRIRLRTNSPRCVVVIVVTTTVPATIVADRAYRIPVRLAHLPQPPAPLASTLHPASQPAGSPTYQPLHLAPLRRTCRLGRVKTNSHDRICPVPARPLIITRERFLGHRRERKNRVARVVPHTLVYVVTRRLCIQIHRQRPGITAESVSVKPNGCADDMSTRV